MVCPRDWLYSKSAVAHFGVGQNAMLASGSAFSVVSLYLDAKAHLRSSLVLLLGLLVGNPVAVGAF